MFKDYYYNLKIYRFIPQSKEYEEYEEEKEV